MFPPHDGNAAKSKLAFLSQVLGISRIGQGISGLVSLTNLLLVIILGLKNVLCVVP